MAAGVTVITAGRTWTIKYAASSSNTLPYTLCTFDLIPKRVVVIGDANAVAGGEVIIQSQPAGGSAEDVYHQIFSGADINPTEQRPTTAWSGPIVITKFDVGAQLFIDLN